MLIIFVLLAVAMPFAANAMAAQRGLPVTDRQVAFPFLGAELVIVGYGLTPGIGWGRTGEHPAVNTLSTIVWLVGVVILVVAAVRWLKARPEAHLRCCGLRGSLQHLVEQRTLLGDEVGVVHAAVLGGAEG